MIKEVTDARAAFAGARNPQERLQTGNQMESALSRLLVVVENYPQLKSNENFLRLQDELAGSVHPRGETSRGCSPLHRRTRGTED